MAQTAETLRNKAENLKAGILQLTMELKKTNDEILAYTEAHAAEVANLNARHEAELARLNADYEDMTELAEKNLAFINTVGQLLG